MSVIEHGCPEHGWQGRVAGSEGPCPQCWAREQKREAEVESLRQQLQGAVAERDRYRTALATISDADNPDAPISRETCARVAHDALRGGQ